MEKNEELHFTIVKLNEDKTFRLVCHENGEVIEIFEGNMRSCVNRQLELLQNKGFIAEKWRVRRD